MELVSNQVNLDLQLKQIFYFLDPDSMKQKEQISVELRQAQASITCKCEL